MRKYGIPVCVLVLIIVMCFCAFSQGAGTQSDNPMTASMQEGIEPYRFTEADELLLRQYGLYAHNAPLICYKAPAEATEMEFGLYQFRDGAWQEWRKGMGLEIIDDMPHFGPFEGTIALNIHEGTGDGTYWIDIHLNDESCGAASKTDFSELVDFNALTLSKVHLEEHQPIILGEPIPLLVLNYNDAYAVEVDYDAEYKATGRMHIGSEPLQEWFNPERANEIAELDAALILALVVTFR